MCWRHWQVLAGGPAPTPLEPAQFRVVCLHWWSRVQNTRVAYPECTLWKCCLPDMERSHVAFLSPGYGATSSVLAISRQQGEQTVSAAASCGRSGNQPMSMSSVPHLLSWAVFSVLVIEIQGQSWNAWPPHLILRYINQIEEVNPSYTLIPRRTSRRRWINIGQIFYY